MKVMIKLSLLFFLFTSTAYAALTIQPIVGYERVQKFSPTLHTKDRAVVGMRFLYGLPLLSLEAEGTRGEDTETFPESNLTINEESYAARLGIRSSFNLIVARWYLRAGGQARKNTITRTENSVTTTLEPAVYVSPYAGTGFSMNVMGTFVANAGVTVIFTGRPKGSDREYQTTLGIGVRI